MFAWAYLDLRFGQSLLHSGHLVSLPCCPNPPTAYDRPSPKLAAADPHAHTWDLCITPQKGKFHDTFVLLSREVTLRQGALFVDG